MGACGVCSVIRPAAVKAAIRTRYWRASLTPLEAKAIPIRRPILGGRRRARSRSRRDEVAGPEKSVSDRENSRRLRLRCRRTVEQLADLRLAGAAIGAGFQPPADGIDVARAFEDFGRDLTLSDAEARADDRPDVFTGLQRLPCQERHTRLWRKRVFRKQAGQPRARY